MGAEVKRDLSSLQVSTAEADQMSRVSFGHESYRGGYVTEVSDEVAVEIGKS